MGWTRAQAEAFMREHTALTEINISNEVDRYIGWPGQALAYKVGQLEIFKLRARGRGGARRASSISRRFTPSCSAPARSRCRCSHERVHAWIASDEVVGLRRASARGRAASLVVGTIIGTGVFLKTAVMAQLGGSAAWVLAAWAVAGVLSLAGALTYAELGAMFPRAGGEYVYLREGSAAFARLPVRWNAVLDRHARLDRGVRGRHRDVPRPRAAVGRRQAGRARADRRCSPRSTALNVRAGGDVQTALTVDARSR